MGDAVHSAVLRFAQNHIIKKSCLIAVCPFPPVPQKLCIIEKKMNAKNISLEVTMLEKLLYPVSKRGYLTAKKPCAKVSYHMILPLLLVQCA